MYSITPRFINSCFALSGGDYLSDLTFFAASMNLMPLVSGLLSFVLAALVIGTVALGAYLLFAPSDTLVVLYQNYHLRRSMRPLKDEDFGSYASIVRRMRSLGVISLLVAVGIVLFVLHSFEPVAAAG